MDTNPQIFADKDKQGWTEGPVGHGPTLVS